MFVSNAKLLPKTCASEVAIVLCIHGAACMCADGSLNETRGVGAWMRNIEFWTFLTPEILLNPRQSTLDAPNIVDTLIK